jgi:hypothetical protein
MDWKDLPKKNFAEWFGTCPPLILEFFLSGLYQNGKSPCMICPFFYVSSKIQYVLPLKSEHRSYAAITCLLPSNEMCVVNGPKCPIISHGVSKFLLVESDYPPPQLLSLPYGPCWMNQNPQVHHAGRMVCAYETLFQVIWSWGEV